ncbi:MAG: PGF-CTERM sorting domain-containing protein [Candidatus Kariarchaeaceae archaeon]|jgi:PGF-CTERM protein
MEGTFKVGSGSDDSALPGFGFLVTLIGLLAVLVIPIVKRRN